MAELRPALRLYLVAVLVAAGLAVLGAWLHRATASPHALALAVLVAFAAIAQARPLHLSPKMKIGVDDMPMFAMALLFEPAYAGVGAAVAMLGSRLGRPDPWYGHAFNVASAMLAVMAGSAAYRALAPAGFAQAPEAAAAAAAAAGAALYAVRTGLVDLVVALQLRRDPRANWLRLHARGLTQTLALYALGVLAALVVATQPLALILFVVPVGLLYGSLREIARLRARTRAAIFDLADLLDRRDSYTHGHSERVAAYAERVARHMGLPPAQVELVSEAGRLHDLGKIGTSDEVLRKPAALAGHELVAMRAHPEYGARILAQLPDFWEGAALVASHHERYDGSGYPRGLRGAEIPLEVAIIAVADAYDAMSTARPYRPALSWTDIQAELERGRGSQWDARVVDAFLEAVGNAAQPATPALAAG